MKLLYEGKAKKVYLTDKPEALLMEFKDSLTAFNALKKGEFPGKGILNCKIATWLFMELGKANISHHWIETREDRFMLVQRTRIIPLEVVVRNVVAGSLAKKLGQAEGAELSRPIVEFYYKDDALGDPFVNEDQISAFGWATGQELGVLRARALKINTVLLDLFARAGMRVIDFKLEFGVNHAGEIILADEISPDCMRIWDTASGKKLDKDRFRQDLGDIGAAYEEVYNRLKRGDGHEAGY